jgi:HAD superfamily hydrolase (TIGR01484 family)
MKANAEVIQELKLKKKIFVFDLDGTLVFDGLKIEPPIEKELLRLNCTEKIIFASARPVRDMLPLLEKFPQNDLIGGNGSMTRQNGKIRVTATLSVSTVRFLSDFIKKNHLEYIVDYDWDYSVQVSQDNAILRQLDSNHLAKNIDLKYEKVTKIILFQVSNEQYESLKSIEDSTMIYHENVQELVFTVQNIDKYETLKNLIDEKKYTAFGNDKNDIQLLKNAEFSVVIGNQIDRKSVV